MSPIPFIIGYFVWSRPNYVVTYKVCFVDSKPILYLDASISLVKMDDLELLDIPVMDLFCSVIILLTEISLQPVVLSPHKSAVAMLTDGKWLSMITISGVKCSFELTTLSFKGCYRFSVLDASFKDTCIRSDIIYRPTDFWHETLEVTLLSFSSKNLSMGSKLNLM